MKVALKTIHDIKSDEDINSISFNYQKELTEKLDSLYRPFDQSVLNEIVLWKVNRYAEINTDTIALLNTIDKDEQELNEELTESILKRLLSKKQKGVGLPMASTFLRFRNRGIYQILDQRTYRFLYGKKLKLTSDINEQINLYFKYLKDLRKKCISLNIPFEDADRILYSLDKEMNKDFKLTGY